MSVAYTVGDLAHIPVLSWRWGWVLGRGETLLWLYVGEFLRKPLMQRQMKCGRLTLISFVISLWWFCWMPSWRWWKEAWHKYPCIPDGSGSCLELWLWHRLLISYPCMQTGVVEYGWKSLDDITFGQFLKRSGSCSELEWQQPEAQRHYQQHWVWVCS